jgi:hypothetical protein
MSRSHHGAPPQPPRFFENVHRHVILANQGVIVLAKKDGQPIAGAVFFSFGKSALYKFAGSDGAFKHLQANSLVLWTAIQHYAQLGFSTLDFGRTSDRNPGLQRFKLGWNPTERHINYYKYSPKYSDFVRGTERSAIWQKIIIKSLPRPVSQLIGTAAYRHFA